MDHESNTDVPRKSISRNRIPQNFFPKLAVGGPDPTRSGSLPHCSEGNMNASLAKRKLLACEVDGLGGSAHPGGHRRNTLFGSAARQLFYSPLSWDERSSPLG